MIKLIAIDLDGTLLKNDKTLSKKNIDVLRQAKEKGVKIVICTGRPLLAIQSILDEIGLRDEGDYSITFNGGAVQANQTKDELLAIELTREQVVEMHDLMTTLDLPLDVISNETCYHLKTSSPAHASIYESLNPLLSYQTVELSELPQDIVYNKMVVGIEANYLDQQIAKIPDVFFEKFNLMKSRTCLLEILHLEVSKANGIQKLANYLGINQKEVMAIGDEENDRSMIEYAGLGVVMENGNTELKKKAQFVTKANEEDGVAYAIEKFVLNIND
ncbi:Cof-type HAD-IIB family hydrolase [Vagococcus sp.]|uniref:Cof-type HAD-IIB family hydrolase n=1 Tax=Vagococcus sp. TaxID=1933889 RepID=UPI003F9821A5